eukprot:365083-Chlamydomonas_euryale.AAC.3
MLVALAAAQLALRARLWDSAAARLAARLAHRGRAAGGRLLRQSAASLRRWCVPTAACTAPLPACLHAPLAHPTRYARQRRPSAAASAASRRMQPGNMVAYGWGRRREEADRPPPRT